jgi:outer membrane protein TolC
VSTFWEGDRAVPIKLRLEATSRASFEDIEDTYVNSALTGAWVPLRAVARVEPEWQTSRIVRRNGVPTLTVRAFQAPGVYASTILAQAMPRFEALDLPTGYRLSYGGEKDNQDETFPQMLGALAISLVAIFLILLVQFRRISEPVVVMASIPLTLLGAAFGLLVTGNPFGFTSFMGVISLCGIVVRNGIILVGYCNERIAEGVSLEQAAREAGARRLRPIFLTSMAAAVGMVPMILSGSSLWSPLASVMAFGLVFSMFFTLLVVPVLFVAVQSHSGRGGSLATVPAAVAIVACAFLTNGREALAQPATHRLTLSEAVQLARERNSVLRIARAKVTEADETIKSAKSYYFPQLSNNTKFVGLSDTQLISIPAGSLGQIAGIPFPEQNARISQSDTTVLLSETTVGQPVTQLLKVRERNEIARADRGIAAAELAKSENETVLAVHQLYYALLIAKKERAAVQASLEAAEHASREAEATVTAGNVLNVALTGATARRLQFEQALLVADARIADAMADLNDLVGFPSDDVLEVSEAGLPPLIDTAKDQAHADARVNNGELIVARETVEKARHAVRAAKFEFIPDVTVFARHSYQHGAAFLENQLVSVGAELNWNIFDWGKRRGEVGQRAAQLLQAQENASRIDKRIGIDIDKAYRKLERAKQLMDAAREALLYETENARLSGNRQRVGIVTIAGYAESVAALRKAEMLDLQASLAYRLAAVELDQIRGVLAVRP